LFLIQIEQLSRISINMADLDDFFAKKDRKKSKGKKLTSEELVKKLETDTKAKKEKPMTTITEGGVQEEVSTRQKINMQQNSNL
jgi:hypothetical protein